MRTFDPLPEGTPKRPWSLDDRGDDPDNPEIAIVDACGSSVLEYYEGISAETLPALCQAINDHDSLVDEVERLRGVLVEAVEYLPHVQVRERIEEALSDT